MYKLLMLLCLLVGSMSFLPISLGPPKGDGTPQYTPTAQPLANTPLTYFSLSESSSYFKRVQYYEYHAKDGAHEAHFYMANEEEPLVIPVDEAWVVTLNGFISQYGMDKWDGFRGSASGLLDGTHFSVEFALADGTSVSASGYGRFPSGYGDASSAIDEHFMNLLPEDLWDW